jgi:hypothetical protein
VDIVPASLGRSEHCCHGSLAATPKGLIPLAAPSATTPTARPRHAARLAFDDRPPGNKGELVAFFDDRERATRWFHGAGELVSDGLAVGGSPRRQSLYPGHFRAGAGDLPLTQRGNEIGAVKDTTVLRAASPCSI